MCARNALPHAPNVGFLSTPQLFSACRASKTTWCSTTPASHRPRAAHPQPISLPPFPNACPAHLHVLNAPPQRPTALSVKMANIWWLSGANVLPPALMDTIQIRVSIYAGLVG